MGPRQSGTTAANSQVSGSVSVFGSFGCLSPSLWLCSRLLVQRRRAELQCGDCRNRYTGAQHRDENRPELGTAPGRRPAAAARPPRGAARGQRASDTTMAPTTRTWSSSAGKSPLPPARHRRRRRRAHARRRPTHQRPEVGVRRADGQTDAHRVRCRRRRRRRCTTALRSNDRAAARPEHAVPPGRWKAAQFYYKRAKQRGWIARRLAKRRPPRGRPPNRHRQRSPMPMA